MPYTKFPYWLASAIAILPVTSSFAVGLGAKGYLIGISKAELLKFDPAVSCKSSSQLPRNDAPDGDFVCVSTKPPSIAGFRPASVTCYLFDDVVQKIEIKFAKDASMYEINLGISEKFGTSRSVLYSPRYGAMRYEYQKGYALNRAEGEIEIRPAFSEREGVRLLFISNSYQRTREIRVSRLFDQELQLREQQRQSAEAETRLQRKRIAADI